MAGIKVNDRMSSAAIPTAVNTPNCRCGTRNVARSERNPAMVVREVITTGEVISLMVASTTSRLGSPRAATS